MVYLGSASSSLVYRSPVEFLTTSSAIEQGFDWVPVLLVLCTHTYSCGSGVTVVCPEMQQCTCNRQRGSKLLAKSE